MMTPHQIVHKHGQLLWALDFHSIQQQPDNFRSIMVESGHTAYFLLHLLHLHLTCIQDLSQADHLLLEANAQGGNFLPRPIFQACISHGIQSRTSTLIILEGIDYFLLVLNHYRIFIISQLCKSEFLRVLLSRGCWTLLYISHTY